MNIKNDEDYKLNLIKLIEEGVGHWNMHRPSERQRGNSTHVDKHIDLSNQDFSNQDLRGIDFENVNLKGTKFDGANLSGSILIKINTDEHTSFKGATLDKSIFKGSRLVGVNCEESTFIEANLSDSSFYQVNFKSADLTKVIVNTRTRFDSIDECDKCKIEKTTLNSLETKDDKIGGLHLSSLNKMSITDDFGKLKLSFSGFWKTVHAVSLLIFMFPYAFFLFKLWSISYGLNLFDEIPATTATIGAVFWEYVYSAGELNGEFSYLSLIALILVLYNLCRILLLWKTITLEHRESVYNLPISFRLNTFWISIYKIVTFGVLVNIILISINTFNFLSRPLVG